MLTSISNISRRFYRTASNNGKSLEYAHALALHRNGIKIAPSSYKRFYDYAYKFTNLNTKNAEDFLTCADIVVNHLSTLFQSPRYIHLMCDRKGMLGVVADVVVQNTNHPNVHLSIKNNKNSAKSQRPQALPRQCGVQGEIAEQYLNQYRLIIDRFYTECVYKNTFVFTQCYSKLQLYECIYNLVCEFIKNLPSDNVVTLFKFLSSVDDHYLIVNNKNKVTIIDKTNKITLPTRVNVSRNNLGYIILEFDNGYVYQLRLSNSSSRITQNVSIKFHTTLINDLNLHPYVIVSK